MKKFDNIIIGFGKGGKTLAGALAGAGQSVVLVEQSRQMYGGTCINVACIPSKSLENSARQSASIGGTWEDKAVRYQKAIGEKRRLTAALRQKNYDKTAGTGAQILTGHASFLDDHQVQVVLEDGSREVLYGDRIFINTGARPFIPPIPGLMESGFAYTSETMMELERLPKQLLIIGGGYIGLEFASYYANFGSQVTVVQDGEAFIPKEDAEIAEAVLKSLEDRGVSVIRGAQVKSVGESGGMALAAIGTKDGEMSVQADAILVATGRRPNLEGLHPEAAGIALTERGAVKADAQLRTSVPHIWAMGDVAGGLQFTYISLDDSRIVKSQLLGDESRTTENRGAVPYSVFLDPPLSRVGLTEAEAAARGYDVGVAKLAAAAVPKAQVLRQPVGMLKAVIDKKTGQILGAHFFCQESHEMINMVKLAIDAKLSYTVLRDGIYTHPTMSEALNDLFASVK